MLYEMAYWNASKYAMMINNDYISLYPSEGTPAGLCQENENNNVKFIKILSFQIA